MSQQLEVLDRLYKFYSKRYSGNTLEEKMNTAVQDLIDTADINLATAMKFFAENDIEPKLKGIKKSSSSSSSSSSNYDPCSGGGSGYSRSYC